MFNVYLSLSLILIFTNVNLILTYSNIDEEQLVDEILNEIDNEYPNRQNTIDLAIKLKNDFDDDLVSELFATSYNLEKIARIHELSNSLFHFKYKHNVQHGNRRKRHISNHLNQLRNDDRVDYVVPLKYLKREKRLHVRNFKNENYRVDDELKRYLIEKLNAKKFNLYGSDGGDDDDLNDVDVNKDLNFNDHDFKKEWYVVNKGQLKTPSGHDLNIKDAWLQGYTGKGIVIVIIDDGLDHEHPDLILNYKPEYSYDYNDENDLEHDPMPSTFDSQNNHGTKCAGAAAANANNSICGVGVAYNAFIGGIRILDGPITDLLEARALLFKANDIHIKSASWGPRDDGMHMEYPGFFVNHALEEGVKIGRNGLGTIYIWASGNGGGNDDDCSCDGYVSNWNVISIGSVNYNGLSPFFTEKCPSTMAVVYSGGATKMGGDPDDPGIRVVTSDVRGKCTTSFQGTSAAAPLAAGAIALLLEANPNVTYRDVMYLIIRTVRIPNVEDKDGWIVNGAGYHVNEKYGFGVMDVGQLIQEAQKWRNVGNRYSCQVEYDGNYPEIPPGTIIKMHINVKFCENVEQLEHVVANISFQYPFRGEIKFTLISPSGTPSEILSYRKHDRSSKGVKNFPFMTLFKWGESPIGEWTLIIETKEHKDEDIKNGNISYFALRLFGTTTHTNEKLVSRFLEKPTKKAFKLDYDNLKDIYVEEKRLSRESRIISRNLLESNPELRTLLQVSDTNKSDE